MNKWALALPEYVKYFKLPVKPTFATLMPYADSYMVLDQHAKAIPLLKQAIALTTIPAEKAGAQQRLAESYYETDDYVRALELYRQLNVYAPKDDDILYHLGMCYMRLGKKPEAQAAQKKLATMNRISAGNLQSWIDGMK